MPISDEDSEFQKMPTKLYWLGKNSVVVFAGDSPDLFQEDWQSITITRLNVSEGLYVPIATGTSLADIAVKI